MKPLILEALDTGHSEGVLVVELVEASTLSALSGRRRLDEIRH
jgi:hypothetical protein